MEDTTCRRLRAAVNDVDDVLMCHDGYILAGRSYRHDWDGLGLGKGDQRGMSMEGGRSDVFRIRTALKGVGTMLGY